MKEYTFDAKKIKDQLIQGIRDWFEVNGKGCMACVAMSGGKDSTIVAKLCVEALGRDRVIGIGMPDKGQGLNEADEIAEWMGIKFKKVNIGNIIPKIQIRIERAFNDPLEEVVDYEPEEITGDEENTFQLSNQAEQNIPPRLRMLILYAISQSMNGRVIGTCNASENYIGYFTKYGDGASDFEPIAELTVHELYQIGDELGIPKKWTYKIPSDDLPHSEPDNDKFERMGFNYEKLDNYLRLGTSGDEVADKAIEKMHRQNVFKLQPVKTIKI